MDLSAQMILFAKVVECASFSAAARSVGHTTSAVSRQIAAIEDRFHVRLLNRTPSGLTLTDEGRDFYERCRSVASIVAEAEDSASSINDKPRGRLKLVSTVAFANAQLMPLLPRFMEQNPEIKFSISLTDRSVDLAGEGIDVAIRFTEQVDNTTQIVRKLAHNKRILCAAPSYIATHGIPKTFADLANHNCLKLSTVARWNDWQIDAKGPRIELNSNFEASTADAVYHAAMAGAGIARLSTFLVNKDIASGKLVRVLPDYRSEGSDILVAFPDRRNLSPRVRVFIDYLVDCFGPVPPWER